MSGRRPLLPLPNSPAADSTAAAAAAAAVAAAMPQTQSPLPPPLLLLLLLPCRKPRPRFRRWRRLWVREATKFTTSVRSRTLNPTWDEHFTLIVHSARYQALTLVVYDSGEGLGGGGGGYYYIAWLGIIT